MRERIKEGLPASECARLKSRLATGGSHNTVRYFICSEAIKQSQTWGEAGDRHAYMHKAVVQCRSAGAEACMQRREQRVGCPSLRKKAGRPFKDPKQWGAVPALCDATMLDTEGPFC